MTENNSEHQNSWDYLSQFISERRLTRFDEVLERRTRHLTVVLEDVFRSHNGSACLRSCEGFGIQDVHVIESDHTYQLNRDIALGAPQWLTMHRYNDDQHDTLTCITQLKQQGFRIVATSPQDDGCPLDQYDISQPTALLFGTEMRGLSPTALAEADEFLTIPMSGFAESFNLSVAVAVCLFQLTRSLRAGEADWQLSTQEKEELKSEWIRRLVDKKMGRNSERFWKESARRGDMTLDELE